MTIRKSLVTLVAGATLAVGALGLTGCGLYSNKTAEEFAAYKREQGQYDFVGTLRISKKPNKVLGIEAGKSVRIIAVHTLEEETNAGNYETTRYTKDGLKVQYDPTNGNLNLTVGKCPDTKKVDQTCEEITKEGEEKLNNLFK